MGKKWSVVIGVVVRAALLGKHVMSLCMTLLCAETNLEQL